MNSKPLAPTLLLLLACQAELPPEAMIASWSGGDVSASEYASWLAHRRADDTAETRQPELERMLVVRSLSQAGLRAGLDRTEDFPRLEVLLEEDVLARLVRQHRHRAITVTEAEVDALVEQYPNAFQKPDRRFLRNLFKRKPPAASDAEIEQLRAAMEELRSRVLAGEDFRELARLESESQTRFRQAGLGMTVPGDLPPALERIAWALDEKEVSQVLESRDGFTLIYCDRIPPPKTPSAAEVRQRFRSNLSKQKSRQDWDQFLTQLRERAEVTIDPSMTRAPEAVIAYYSGGEITARELELNVQATARRKIELATMGTPAIRDQLQSFITRRLVAETGRAAGLDQTEEFRELTAWRRREALAVREIASRVQSRLAEPTEVELREFFDRNSRRFRRREEFELSVLRLTYPRGDSAARGLADERARHLHGRLAGSEISFEQAARELSSHTSASEGGYLGWVSKPRLAALSLPLGRAVTNLSGPGLSPEVDDDGSYWLAWLHDSKPERPTTFEEVREEVHHAVGTHHAKRLQAEVMDEQRLQLSLVVAPEASNS